MFLDYLPIVAAVFSVIVTVICVLLGVKRGVLNSGMRLAFFILAGVASYFLAKYVAGLAAEALYLQILPMLELEIELPSLEKLTQKAVAGLLSPICFIILFFIIDKLTFIIYKPLKSFFSKKRSASQGLLNRIFGGVLGAVLAVAIIAVCLMPVNGYVGFIDETLDSICATSLGADIPEEIPDTVAQINDLPGMQLTRDLSGWLFHALSEDANAARDSVMIVISAADSMSGFLGGNGNPDQTPSGTQPPATQIFENLTVESAELVSELISDALQSMMPEEAPVASVVGSIMEEILVGLANSKDSMSPDEYQAEANAVQSIISEITEDTDTTPAALLENVLSSNTITNAVIAIADELPTDLAEELKSDTATQQELAAVMSRASAKGTVSSDALNTIARLLGLPEIY